MEGAAVARLGGPLLPPASGGAQEVKEGKLRWKQDGLGETTSEGETLMSTRPIVIV